MRLFDRKFSVMLWHLALSVSLLFSAVVPSWAEPGPDAAGWEQADALTEIPAPSIQTAETTEGIRSNTAVADLPFQLLSTIRAVLPTVMAAPDLSLIQERLRRKIAGPPEIGAGVDIPELKPAGAVHRNSLQLLVPGGGTLLGMRINSPGAVAMRLGLLIEHIPSEVKIAFFSAGTNEAVASPVTGKEIAGLIELNRTAGDLSDEGRTYWSPVVKGENAVILFYLPEGVPPLDLRFTIPRISHIFQEPLLTQSAFYQSASYCNLDATCYPDWSAEANAAAKMVFTENGWSYLCTGSLLADKDPSSFIPYFLSANHCLSTQTVASTLQTYWFYQSASCNSSVLDSYHTALTGGATLLYASSATDTSFMRLNKQPPGGASYLGWTTTLQSTGAGVTGIHHPQGDWKKISFGVFDGFADCQSDSDTTLICYPASSSTGGHLYVGWASGLTEGGSSGSALLNSSGQLIGQLSGGSGSCGGYAESFYGRFDLAYEAGLKQWLSAASGKPDFKVTAISLSPATPTAGGTFSATVTVKNRGTASGDGKYLDVWTHQARSQSCGADGNAWTSVGNLAAGASKSFTFTGLSAGSFGSKTFRAFVDSGCGTAESSETNNQLARAYTVSTVPTGVSLSVSPQSPSVAGTAVTATATGQPLAAYEYRFRLKTGSTWAVVQNWSTSRVWKWATAGSAAGTYSIQVGIRQVGSTGGAAYTRAIGYTLR